MEQRFDLGCRIEEPRGVRSEEARVDERRLHPGRCPIPPTSEDAVAARSSRQANGRTARPMQTSLRGSRTSVPARARNGRSCSPRCPAQITFLLEPTRWIRRRPRGRRRSTTPEGAVALDGATEVLSALEDIDAWTDRRTSMMRCAACSPSQELSGEERPAADPCRHLGIDRQPTAVRVPRGPRP